MLKEKQRTYYFKAEGRYYDPIKEGYVLLRFSILAIDEEDARREIEIVYNIPSKLVKVFGKYSYESFFAMRDLANDALFYVVNNS